MKKVIYIPMIAVLFSCSSKNDSNFTIEGKVSNSDIKTLYLEENNADATAPVVIDSVKLNNGSFRFETTTKGEGLFSLRADQNTYPFAQVISDAAKISIQADLSNANDPYTVSGSNASMQLLEFRRKMNKEGQAMARSVSQFESLGKSISPDSIPVARVDSMRKTLLYDYQTASEEMKNYTVNLLDKSNSPVLSLYIFGAIQKMFEQFGIKAFNKTEMVAVVDKMADKFPAHPVISNIKKNTASAKATDFSLPDTTGKPLPLSSFKGKYVLVDFWASWCKPCREENPNVVAAYKKFNSKNFTILGVSLDQSRDLWLQAIQNDALTWNHVSDLKYWNSEAAALYNVQSIPYNFLVDPDGNIIAEDIRGENLHQTLNTFLK